MRQLWVTETNCNWEGYHKIDKIKTDFNAPTSEESCNRITGQEEIMGIGSIAYMVQNDVFERIAWWNTWNFNTKNRDMTTNARMVDDEGHVLPIGRALLSKLNSELANCDEGLQYE